MKLEKTISLRIDNEMKRWLKEIKIYYEKDKKFLIQNQSDLIRTIIMREYFRTVQ